MNDMHATNDTSLFEYIFFIWIYKTFWGVSQVGWKVKEKLCVHKFTHAVK